MRKLKKGLILLLITLFTTVSYGSALASDGVEEIFKGAFYGGLAGTLIGGAMLAFTKHPSDHLMNLGYGAAVGVFAGAGFSLIKSTKSLAEVKDGTVRFALPTIIPEAQDAGGGKVAFGVSTQLMKGTF